MKYISKTRHNYEFLIHLIATEQVVDGDPLWEPINIWLDEYEEENGL